MHKQTGFLIRRIVNRRILFVSFTKICTWGRQLYTHTDTHARARARAIISVKKRGAFHTTRSDCARKPDAMNGKINILYGLRYDILRYLLAQRIFLRALWYVSLKEVERVRHSRSIAVTSINVCKSVQVNDSDTNDLPRSRGQEFLSFLVASPGCRKREKQRIEASTRREEGERSRSWFSGLKCARFSLVPLRSSSDSSAFSCQHLLHACYEPTDLHLALINCFQIRFTIHGTFSHG